MNDPANEQDQGRQDQGRQDHDDQRQRALRRDLRELARVQPTPEATTRAIQRARAAIDQTLSRQPPTRKQIMTLRNVGAIAAALLAMALLKHWLTPERETGFAFGAVQKNVEQAKSVQYVEKRKTSVDDRAEPDVTRKVMILGPRQIREEIEVAAEGDPLPAGKIRSATAPERYTIIFNANDGKTITLYPGKKGYVVPIRTLGIDPDSNEVKEEKIGPLPDVNFYQRIRDFPSDSAQRLPERMIDGKRAIGFQTAEKKKRGNSDESWTRTYWVNPETKLPVQIVTRHASVQGKETVTSEWVQSDIVFDAPLDESLFSTEPPEGYKDLAPPEQRKDEREQPKLNDAKIELK